MPSSFGDIGVSGSDAEQAWIGNVGDTVKLLARVESTRPLGHGILWHLLRDTETGSFLEWVTGRRHKFAKGDLLHVSGRIYAHTHRDGVPVSVLRDCFNPRRELR